jgi:hypothetical protein
MAGGLPVREGVVIGEGPGAPSAQTLAESGPGRIVHRYGRVGIVHVEPGDDEGSWGQSPRSASDLSEDDLDGLSAGERLGVEALRMRESEEFRAAKRQRPRDGEAWDLGGCTNVVSPPEARPQAFLRVRGTSDFFEGTIALSIVFVSGPGDLAISHAEKTKFVAEAQEALSWYKSVAPKDLGLDFQWETSTLTLTVPKDEKAKPEELEKVWLDPTLKAAQEPTALSYVENLRARLKTQWAYCAFVTKYPLQHPAYASDIGGPYLVMDAVGGWGPDNIDRVFAHETGHIFGAPDEYKAAPCSCGDTFGRFDIPNGNCETRDPGGGTGCVMQHNTFNLCSYTPAHFGWEVDGPLLNGDSSLVVDISGGSKGDGAAAIQLPYTAADNQHFTLRAVGNGEVCIISKHSGKVLTVSGGAMNDGAKVVQWIWRNHDYQRFTLHPVDDRWFVLRAKHSGMVLDVQDPHLEQGQGLIQTMPSGLVGQQWTYRALPILARHSGKVLDVSGGGTNDGTEVVQFPTNGGDNQRFLAVPVGNGYVRLVAKHSGKVLDVSGASNDNGAKVVQWTWHGGDNQRFKIEPVGIAADGYSRIIAKHSGKVLDVLNSSTDVNASIVQWDWNSGTNQRWKIL